MQKTCPNCQASFEVTDKDRNFYKKFEVPEPTFCPDCRQQRRIIFRNDQNYYKRQCKMCRKEIISIYSPDKPFPVFCKDCFWSDKYDPLKYGQDFDFNRPFLEQFEEMRSKVPRIAIFNTQSENADYTVHSSKNRNCYMGSSFVENEDCYYGDWVWHSKDSVDNDMCQRLEKCYFCTGCDDCYNSSYLDNCMNMNFSYLCFDCRGSNNLIGCVSLRKKEYMILNKPASRKDFQQTLDKLHHDTNFRKNFQKKYKALKLHIPVKYFWEKNSENCTGNYIVNSKNAHHSYNVTNVEDVRYLYESGEGKDIMDAMRVAGAEMCYEIAAIVNLKFGKFSNLCYQSSNLEYCDNCQSSHDSFGCMSLKNNRYCILNKQYSKEEYEKTMKRIKEHMEKTGEYGEFFPMSLSPYGYNETKAQEFFPLTREQALAKGFKWKDTDLKNHRKQTCKIPKNIADVPDNITKEILACTAQDNAGQPCGRNYKIIPQELKFYRAQNLPIPEKCPNCRHKERATLQNPHKLYARTCAKCAAPLQTTYAPDRPEIVYCGKCYLETIY